MADNYLENKMEEHRKSLARPTARKSMRRVGVLSPGLHLQYPPMWVAVLTDTAAEAEPYVAALHEAGISIALCARNGGREATVLAQRFGVRMYPDRYEITEILSDLIDNGHSPKYILNLRGDENYPGAIGLSSQTTNMPKTILARELLFLLHPEHENLLTSQTLFHIQI